MAKAKTIEFNILKTLGTVSTSATGWTKDLSIVSWNGGAPKYDLREWSPDKTRMGKGSTLSAAELLGLKDIINNIADIPGELE